ncbi:MAG: hypothetical protein EB070_05495 [Synechococcaceae bacterium WBA_2_066]|nr:hypothetical protein [Synechococcaceae bacterium WB6_1A_059]NBP32888.1 hypothetical protein [Synechococcaceae bacterium WB6_1B_055]NBP98681.1 hypothetical protein [Synechococcaceae bacterium WB6_3A_227]NBQ19737.1 hypothetical protein [Synechococcaceae bacterium WB5_2A_257]NBR45147.1 hypothetical protein [Synechococcaceae bacterium WB5_2B_268]NBY60620.1 hypothetical protein [Synechococcaceae bacterium LLD_019]NCU76614.1 hypothetical protein [Synechococcaceae bacterium WB7_1C_051]NCU91231.1
MAQLTIKLSDKALALITQLQKEIFNRRRKKVTTAGVVETLIESGAKSQSDKRFAASWQNLVADIERAAKVADTYGNKPSSLSDAEWALVLSHRTRPQRKPVAPKSAAAAKRTAAKPSVAKPRVAKKAVVKKPVARPAASNGAVVQASVS